MERVIFGQKLRRIGLFVLKSVKVLSENSNNWVLSKNAENSDFRRRTTSDWYYKKYL